MSSILSNDLREPLLETAVPFGITDAENAVVETSSNNDEDDDTALENNPSYMTWFDCFVIWTILPVLLWVDFSMALVIHDKDNDAAASSAASAINVRLVQVSILLFIVASYMYRKTIQDWRVSHAVLVLMPEILMDLVLLLILFGHLMTAFRALLCSIFGLSVFVLVYNVRVLCKKEQKTEEGDSRETSKHLQVV
jgi:hypothetical protein